MLNAAQIEQGVRVIESQLSAANPEATAGGATTWGLVGQTFQTLREQYRQRPASLAAHAARLSELRTRFDGILEPHLSAVVDHFREINDQIRQLEMEREFWREYLVRKTSQLQREELRGNSSFIRVRTTQTREIPPAGTASRKTLEQLIRDAGQWQLVSQLSRPKLQQAIAEKKLEQPLAESIDRMCPMRTTYAVVSRPMGSSA